MTWESIKVFFGKAFVAVFMRIGFYRIWSKIYQFINEGHRVLPLQRFANMAELVGYVGKLKWRADSWRQLWDAISSPEAVQWQAVNDPEKFIGDCDEFAVYQAAVINNEIANDSIASEFFSKERIVAAFVMSVSWYKKGGEVWEGNPMGYGGHNVCLLWHINGQWSYMDYGFPSFKCDAIAEVAEIVRKRYAQVYEPLAYVVSHPDTLELVDMEVHW